MKIRILIKNNTFLFVTIILLAVILRLFTLFHFGTDKFIFQGDEPNYYNVAKNIYNGNGPVENYVWNFWFDHKSITHLDDAYPPLFSYFLAGFFYVFNDSILISKLVSLILSILTIILIYFIAKSLYGEKVGLLSMFFLSIIPTHVIYSVSTMREIAFSFFVLLFIFFFYKALITNRVGYFIFSALFLAISILINYVGFVILVLALLSLVLFKNRKKYLKGAIFFLLIVLILILPLGITTYKYFKTPYYSIVNSYKYTDNWHSSQYSDEQPTIKSFISLGLDKIFYYKAYYIGRIVLWLPIIILPIIFIFFILGLLFYDKFFKLILFLFLGYLIFYILSINDLLLWNSRYFLFLIPPILIIASSSIIKITSNLKKDNKKIVNAFLIVILLFSFVFSIFLLFSDIKDIDKGNYKEIQNSLKEMSVWVENNTNKDDVILTHLPLDVNYYFDRLTVIDSCYVFLTHNTNLETKSPKISVSSLISKYNVKYVLVKEDDKEFREKLFNCYDINLNAVYIEQNQKFYLYKVV